MESLLEAVKNTLRFVANLLAVEPLNLPKQRGQFDTLQNGLDIP